MIDIVSKSNPDSIKKASNDSKLGVSMSTAKLGHLIGSKADLYSAAFSQQAKVLGRSGVDYLAGAVYGGPIHVPQKWSDGSTQSAFERVVSGKFNLKNAKAELSSNTLNPDWQQLWDAIRMDITVRKNALPTVRQYMYNVYNRPDLDKTNKLSSALPYSVIFEENNGSGQPVRQGQTLGGKAGSFDINVYAAGWSWDLVAMLFDKSIDATALNDAVAVGYNAKRDDIAISPIFAGSYGTVGTTKWTAADTTSGAGRQELLYNTIENAVDDFSQRKDPDTGRKIPMTDLIALCSSYDAMHIQRVINGLPQNEGNTWYGAISQISNIVAYDGETINTREGSVTYDGVTDGYIYLVKPNRYMDVFVKAGLTTEIDMQPDVKTLTQEQRSWWYAEGIYNDEGISNFIQKVTLPTW